MARIMRGQWQRVLAWPLLMLLMLATAACNRPVGGTGDTGAPAPTGHLLIAEAYPNGNVGDGSDQFVRLYNPTATAVRLDGWSVGDAKLRATFPAGAELKPRQSLYVALDPAGFRKVMGALPEYAWGTVRADGVVQLHGGASLHLGAAAGVAVLRDGSGMVIDAVAWGALAHGTLPGWKGLPVPPSGPGVVINRARSEASWTEMAPGEYVADTDTAADWKQGTAWMAGRVYRPGQSFFGYSTYTVKNLTLYAAPDTSFEQFARVVDGARSSIDLNIYDFSLVPLAEKLGAAARRGVKVRLLIEAGSATKLFDQERYVGQIVSEAGGEVRWIVDDPGAGYHGRYVYDHAKYAVVDGRLALVQSENIVRHGTPADPSFGNRGWGVVAEDQSLAAYMSRVFAGDWSTAYGDVVAFKPGTPFGPPAPGFVPETGVLKGSYPHPFPALTLREPVAVTPVLAPDHTLLESKGIIGLMRGARESLLIEQQYVHMHCGDFPLAVEYRV